jgi:hypothetical protein
MIFTGFGAAPHWAFPARSHRDFVAWTWGAEWDIHAGHRHGGGLSSSHGSDAGINLPVSGGPVDNPLAPQRVPDDCTVSHLCQ